ncbi:hypothetical protein HDE_06194 [Halotydeus destructor]|nr:hypothetical protein HDE_06194 [Halotydeus destructor]
MQIVLLLVLATPCWSYDFGGCWNERVCGRDNPGAIFGAAAASMEKVCPSLYTDLYTCARRCGSLDPISLSRLTCENSDQLAECLLSLGYSEEELQRAGQISCTVDVGRPGPGRGLQALEAAPYECTLFAICKLDDPAAALAQNQLGSCQFGQLFVSRNLLCRYMSSGQLSAEGAAAAYCAKGCEETKRITRVFDTCMRCSGVPDELVLSVC